MDEYRNSDRAAVAERRKAGDLRSGADLTGHRRRRHEEFQKVHHRGVGSAHHSRWLWTGCWQVMRRPLCITVHCSRGDGFSAVQPPKTRAAGKLGL